MTRARRDPVPPAIDHDGIHKSETDRRRTCSRAGITTPSAALGAGEIDVWPLCSMLDAAV